jgi:hypothetical protein
MKTMWKKTRVIVFACIIALLALPVSSFAAGGLSIGSVKGQVGDLVNVPVKLAKPSQAVASYGLELEFDKNVLAVVGIKDTYGDASATCGNDQEGCFWSNYSNADGVIRVAWADTTAGDHPIDQDISLFTIQFSVKKEITAGDKLISIDTNNPEAFTFVGIANAKVNVETSIAPAEQGEQGSQEDGYSEDKGSQGNGSTEDSDNGNAGEKPADSEESTSPDESPNTNKGKDSSEVGQLPQTGDDSYIDQILNIGIALFATSLVGMWFLNKRRRIKE